MAYFEGPILPFDTSAARRYADLAIKARATSLAVAIVIFRAVDGSLSVVPASEFDHDAEVIAEIDPFTP